MLGTLYEKGDARCDGGFTLFYLGINLALIGPLITGLLQTHPGFHYGFGAAAVGMARALPSYVVPAKPGCARPHCAKPIATRKFAYGVIGMGLAFLLFLPTSGTTGKAVPALLVVGIMAVFAVSELLPPIGLSVTTKLAPEAFRAR